ncbi:MAG: hypothetical protein JO353_05975 [Phycisphaerae bacterium]|nr:hypothetical protein [Phycisphaerae bacterium]
MSSFPNEIDLGLTLGMNALLLFGGWRFVRQWVDDRLDAVSDALLLWYLAQYVIVAGLGVVGVLSGASIVNSGLVIGFALVVAGRGEQARRLNEEKNKTIAPIVLALVAYLLAIIWVSRYAPATANDALAYHLPAAVQWLQTGRVGLFHTWFYNPANTYSPLAGSTFIAWLMGPMGNDSLARFVETPAVLLLFFGVLSLARKLGAGTRTAVVIALAASLARPYISQTVLAKDDVPLAGILVCAVAALSRKRLSDALGPWRLGAAIGLFFAVKYTAMLNAPILLLAIDAPLRAGWRWKNHLLAITVAALLAAPWYVRNWILTGNPIYPTGLSIFGVSIFRGGLKMLHSDRLTSWRGAWDTIVGSYYSPPPALAIIAIVVWIAAAIVSWRRLKNQPLIRACLLGPPIVIALFVLKSPYGEVRLIGASFALLAPLIALLPISWFIAIALAIVSFASSFEWKVLRVLLPGTFIAFAVLLALWMIWRTLRASGRIAFASGIIISLAATVYVRWSSYRSTCELTAVPYWEDPSCYGNYAEAWDVLRNHARSGSTIGYDNFFMVYPLFGADLSRHVVYIPSRPGVHEITDLPFMGPILGEQVPVEVVRVMTEHSDAATWKQNLDRSGAQFLLIGKEDLTHPDRRVHPAELDFVAADPKHFHTMQSNDAVDVYHVLR